jgi:nicotinamidase-related amidase
MPKTLASKPQGLTERSVHLCIDMQRLFAPSGPWPTPWMERVLPAITDIAEHHAAQTVFTRFVPPEKPEDMPGRWRDYYRRWREVTGERLDRDLLELMPPLAALVPPAAVVDKPVYSAFQGSALKSHLRQRRADTLWLPEARRTSAFSPPCSTVSMQASGWFSSPTPCAVRPMRGMRH